MSAALALHDNAPVASLDTLAAIAVYARTVDDPEILKGLTARINAARELAKMQDDVRDIRRMLMHAEVAVIIRRGELEHSKLNAWEKSAYTAFVAAGETGTRVYVDAHFEEHGKASTLGRTLLREQRDEEFRAQGEEFVRDPQAHARELKENGTETEWSDLDAYERYIEGSREDVYSHMQSIIEAFTKTGQPFTVNEVADELIDWVGETPSSCEVYADDIAFRDGVRRMCREAVRASTTLMFEGDRLPASVAVTADQGWVRIPLRSVTPSDLASTIRERELQIARDQASVDRLARFLKSITASGCDEFEPIADYLPAA